MRVLKSAKNRQISPTFLGILKLPDFADLTCMVRVGFFRLVSGSFRKKSWRKLAVLEKKMAVLGDFRNRRLAEVGDFRKKMAVSGDFRNRRLAEVGDFRKKMAVSGDFRNRRLVKLGSIWLD